MEFAFSDHCATFFDRVSSRIRSLPKRFKTEKRVYAKHLVAPFLLIVAALTASLAYQASSEDALQGWLHLHAPSEEIWSAAALSRKYLKRSDPKTLQRLYRSIPSSAEAAGTVWKSSSGSEIAVFLEAAQESRDGEAPFRVYGAGIAPKSVKWEPLGTGWPGFELAVKSMDAYLLAESKKLRNSAEKPAYQDRYEIRY